MKFEKHVLLVFSITTIIATCCFEEAHSQFVTWEWNTYWTYAYATQHGSEGFFGPYDVDGTLSNDFASFNGWLGSSQLVSGSDSGYSLLTSAASTVLTFNPAIVVKAKYQATSAKTGETIGTIIGDGQWKWWWAQLNTPLGNIAYGQKLFLKGAGLQFGAFREEEFLILSKSTSFSYTGHVENAVTDPIARKDQLQDKLVQSLDQRQSKAKTLLSLEDSLQDIYDGIGNPSDESKLKRQIDGINKELRILDTNIKFYRNQIAALSEGWTAAFTSKAAQDVTPNLEFGLGFYPWRRSTKSYWNVDDLNAIRSVSLLAYGKFTLLYFEFQIGSIYDRYHVGPESQLSAADRSSFRTIDTDLTEGWIFSEYNTGNFFWRSELDWYCRTRRNRGLRTDYVESLRFMTESGLLLGPALIKFLWAYMPGPDRRQGQLIDRQPFVMERHLSAASVFGGYSSILAGAYSGGVGGSTNDIPDASTLGVRLDYLLAANLNLTLSFLKSNRLSHGYGWGYVRPSLPSDPGNPGTLDFGLRSDATSGLYSKAIPDDDLGWEVNAGLKWQLLDNLVLEVVYGYWQPGRWFNYACVDKSVANWDVPTAANNWGINPNRTIDPISSIVLGIKIIP